MTSQYRSAFLYALLAILLTFSGILLLLPKDTETTSLFPTSSTSTPTTTSTTAAPASTTATATAITTLPVTESVPDQKTSTTSPSPVVTSTSTELATIVFSADFSSGDGCADHSDSDQCDLYTARIDLSTGEVSDVLQQTYTSVSESYPVWNPNRTVAYASVFQTATKKQINYIDIPTGKTGTLVSTATWPEVSPDGSTLLYATSNTDLLMTAALSNGGVSIGTATALTGTKRQQDPDFSPDGLSVIFHQITDAAHGTILDIATGTTVQYSDRSGHCAFSGLGDFTVCDNSKGGGLFSAAYKNRSLESSSLFTPDLKPSELTVYDDVFSSCNGASFNYPTFCGDDTHVLVSTSCNTDSSGGVSFSRLFLIDLSGSTPIYHPIGKYLAEKSNGPGKSSWTVDCLP